MRFALRSLLKSPSYTVIALVTLALGIGVNTSMYTLVDVLLFRTVPFAQPEQLLSLFTTTPQSPRNGFSFVELEELLLELPEFELEFPAEAPPITCKSLTPRRMPEM